MHQFYQQQEPFRLLDILFCEGGCIGGPGIISGAPQDKRRQKIVNYWEIREKASQHE